MIANYFYEEFEEKHHRQPSTTQHIYIYNKFLQPGQPTCGNPVKTKTSDLTLWSQAL